MAQPQVTADARPKPLDAVRRDRSIGAVLVEAGRLSIADVEQILRVQKDRNLKFGEAAVSLGLSTEEDVRFALSRQFDFPYLQEGDNRVSEEVVAAFRPFSKQVETLRALRSQLMLRWLGAEPERRSIAIVSPSRGEGRTYIAANLAVIFAQLGERTLLIDADLRNPRMHEVFTVPNATGLSTVLSGRGEAFIQRVPALPELSVITAGPTPPNPQELLSRPSFAELLDEQRRKFEVIIIDSPAAEQTADAYMVAARAGAALAVARQNVSKLAYLRDMTERMAVSRATVLGTVLNEG